MEKKNKLIMGVDWEPVKFYSAGTLTNFHCFQTILYQSGSVELDDWQAKTGGCGQGGVL